ncbi:MAG: hypothetical protein ABIZ82_05290 [Candidatus Tumulicola sp.]
MNPDSLRPGLFTSVSQAEEAVEDIIRAARFEADDLRALISCTAAEVHVYATFIQAAMQSPVLDFLAEDYLVVDRGVTQTKRHGRCNTHIANLIRKKLLVPLNPACSHDQYYLMGCRHDGSNYFASWIQASLDWRFSSAPEASAQHSKRAMRPEHAETGKTLKLKGFLPGKPVALSLNSNPQKYGELGLPTRARRAGNLSPAKSPNLSSYKQRLVLAAEIAKLAETASISSGKHGKLLDWLNRTYGCEDALKIVNEAWCDRDSLLSDRYPMFTAQSVYFYARYRRTSHRINKQHQPANLKLQTLISECLNNEGVIDNDQLRRKIFLYGVQRSAMAEAVCREFELDPDQLFSI